VIRVVQAAIVPEGDGVEVKRLMPVAGLRNFDPFVLWDHFDIRDGGFPNHPHRGFEAITYMFEGGMKHKDNLGNQGAVFGGGAQRFTAGKGIIHSEMPDGHAAGIQLWINLPKRLKHIEPDYQQVDAIVAHEKDGVSVRNIVGKEGVIELQTDVEYLDIALDKGTHWEKDVAEGMRGIVYLVEGDLRIYGEALKTGEAALIEDEERLLLIAEQDSRVMFCFGRAHGEPIHQHGSFVD